MPIEIKLNLESIWNVMLALGTFLKRLWRLLSSTPELILPWFYSKTKCGSAVTIISSGGQTGGPTIYVNQERTNFSIEQINLAVINGLPFPITVVNLNLTILFNDARFCSFAKTESEIVVNNTIQQLTPIKIYHHGILTTSHILDTQPANKARADPSDCARLIISGDVTFKTFAREFRKTFAGIQTLAYIHRGTGGMMETAVKPLQN